MNEFEEKVLATELIEDEAKRDRNKYNYTVDALTNAGIMPLSVWPESNQGIADVIRGKIDYNSLPMDIDNEAYKGMTFKNQQTIILDNRGKEPLCEAQNMQPCLKSKCILYRSDKKHDPPICREFKMAFKK